ncbi:MAG: efflux RND transporter periplasmic adaptor subunit [Bacteroidetes bacterium]|nr:efflux RND transporter periplasmic adaptor subunit [Bacteroidota bacterium]
MKNYNFIFLAIVLFAGCKSKNNTTKPSRRDITQAVYASGKIFPLNDYKVFSKLPGYIEKIQVHVGDSVKVGQALMTIRSEVSDLNVNTAKNLLDLARKNANENSAYLTVLKQDVASARSKYELDSTNYIRYSSLMKDNATSKLLVDQAKTQFDISKQNYLKAVNSLTNVRDKIRVELENAQIQYDAQVSNKNDYTITSAVNGKVYDIVPKEGELVNTQIVLMEIGDGSHFEIDLSVDETDVSLIKKDQDIVYSIDAYKDIVFTGKVIEVYPRINQSNKTSKVVSSIVLDSKTIIYSGMSVEANIIISEKKSALVIPREFLFEGNKVKVSGTDESVTISKGASDLEFIEVLKGVDESTEIVKP